MLDEGSELLGRMNDRVDILRTRNVDFMALALAVLSIVIGFLTYALDQGWIRIEYMTFSLLFYVPILASLFLCYRLIEPRKYPELSTFDDPDFEIVMNAPLENALSNLIFWRRKVLKLMEDRHTSEMPIHRRSIGFFVGSLFGLMVFLLIVISA